MDEIDERESIPARRRPVHDADKPPSVRKQVAAPEIAVSEAAGKIVQSGLQLLGDGEELASTLRIANRGYNASGLQKRPLRLAPLACLVKSHEEVAALAHEAVIQRRRRFRSRKPPLQGPVRDACGSVGDRPRYSRGDGIGRPGLTQKTEHPSLVMELSARSPNRDSHHLSLADHDEPRCP
jgi:hypothetical protein